MVEVLSGDKKIKTGIHLLDWGPKENKVYFESKNDSKNGTIYEDDFLRSGRKVNSEHLSTEVDTKIKILQSMEETYNRGVVSENRADDMDQKSERISLNGSDAGYEDSSAQERALSRSSQEASMESSDQEWLLKNTERELFLRGNDWWEQIQEDKGKMDGSMELWESTKEQDEGHGQVDVPVVMGDENAIQHAELGGGPHVYCLPGDTLQVRGTGRPDLDDGEHEFGVADERFIHQPHRSTLPDTYQNSGSGRSDVEEDAIFLEDSFILYHNVKCPCGVMSGIRERSFGKDTNASLLEFRERADEHHQEELRSPFYNNVSENLVDTLKNELPQESKEAVLPNFSKSSFTRTTQIVQLLENFTPKASFGVKMQTSGDQARESGVQMASALKLISEKNLQESGDMRHFYNSEAEEEDYFEADMVSETVEDGLNKKSCIIHLGSMGAEELLHLDVAKVGKAVCTQRELFPKWGTVLNSEGAGLDWATEDVGPVELSRYVEASEMKETYVDTVLDMEDVLFDAAEGAGARIFHIAKTLPSEGCRPARDGSVSASMSSKSVSILRQCGCPATNISEVEWAEVVGALQRQGGASLGDWVVGVKEHTVYRVKVNGGGNQWEIHRRYRDFVVLYNQLRQLFACKDSIHLPTPWKKVKAEARKFFGNTSPDVVEIRSALIQVCLQSLLQAGPPLSTATPLLRFLFPNGEVSCSINNFWQCSGKCIGEGHSGVHVHLKDFANSPLDSPRFDPLNRKAGHDQDDGGHTSVYGKTIRLIVQIHKKQSLKQQLQAQHYSCAGCYKCLDLACGLVPELVQNWGWCGPRFCEYSGQLFCSSCHLYETAVTPAWVLQQWDFAPRQVSQLAKAYLDSIYDKPMLCVSAVNPYLYARVPVLAHLTKIRRNLSKMLICICCPARTRIQAMMGSRYYLLENNDFFALRDLADLSKGAFAVLPGYMKAMLAKLSVHMTRECSACLELGERCGAEELCNDPFELIYPYQDQSIARCQSCHLPYHKRCFLKCQNCSCRKGQSLQMLKDSPYNSGIFYGQLHAEPWLNIKFSSLKESDREFAPTSSSVIVCENKLEAQKNLNNMLGSGEVQCSVSQTEKYSSVVLNISAPVSSLEL